MLLKRKKCFKSYIGRFATFFKFEQEVYYKEGRGFKLLISIISHASKK